LHTSRNQFVLRQILWESPDGPSSGRQLLSNVNRKQREPPPKWWGLLTGNCRKWKLEEIRIEEGQKKPTGNCAGLKLNRPLQAALKTRLAISLVERISRRLFRQFTINPGTHSPINAHVVKPFRSWSIDRWIFAMKCEFSIHETNQEQAGPRASKSNCPSRDWSAVWKRNDGPALDFWQLRNSVVRLRITI